MVYQPRGVGWGRIWEGGSKGGDVCIPMVDSCWGLTENNKIHKVIILQLKNKFFLKMVYTRHLAHHKDVL